jgi:hypothetical protein
MKKAIAIAALFVSALTGTALAESTHEVKVTPPSSAKASQALVAKVSVESKGVWHINKEFPTKLTLEQTDGISLDSAKLTAKEAKIADKSAEFDVKFKATSPGKKEIKGTLKFAVCDEAKTSCVPKTESVVIAVDVK